MKKTLVALAALAVVSAASAQSTVTMYGVVDMGVAQLKDTTGGVDYVKNGVQQGTMSNSRIGFKGTEELGGGLKANFVLEYAVNPDESATTMTNRLGTVGLSGNFGAVTVGRQYTPYFVVQGAMDLLGNLNATPGYIVNNHITNGGRASNSVNYASPTIAGFSGIAQVGAGPTAAGTESINGVPSTGTGSTSQADGKSYGLAAIYAAGPLVAGFGYNAVTNPTSGVASYGTITGATPFAGSATAAAFGALSTEVDVWALGASYDFTVVKASLAYSSLTDKKVAAVSDLTSKGYNFSISAPLGAVTLAANIGRANYEQDATDIVITGYQLMANYALSKRTTAYAVYGADKANDNAAGADVLKRTSTTVGIRHTF